MDKSKSTRSTSIQTQNSDEIVIGQPKKPVIPRTSVSYRSRPVEPDTTSARVELIQAVKLIGRKLADGKEVRTVVGEPLRRVIFRQGGAVMTCDSAIHYPDSNFVAAYGHIVVEQGDSIKMVGDTAFYFGNQKIAQLRGKIELKDKNRTLTTRELDYDMNTGIAGYYNFGRVVDDTSVLDSKIGYYDTRNKKITFIQKVSIYNTQTGDVLNSDTLVYDLQTKTSQFNSKTRIKNNEGTIETEGGSYDPRTSNAEFTRRTCIENDEFRLCANYIRNDKANRLSIARGKVSLHNKKDTLWLYGENIVRLGDTSWVSGLPVLIKPFGKDSLFLTADTLVSIADNSQPQSILAYRKVRIFSGELQAVADSLVYAPQDSVFRFYQKPALWSGPNQMSGDSIAIYLKNGGLEKLVLRKNAFIVSKNELGKFDQVAGKNMTAQFFKNALQRVHVDGNGQLLYHILDKGNLQAVNRMDCSDMIIAFADSNRLSSLTALVKPEARLVPPHELTEAEKRLSGFTWRSGERPAKFLFEVILGRATGSEDPRFFVPGGKIATKEPFRIVVSQDTLLVVMKSDASSEDIKNPFFVIFEPDSARLSPLDTIRAEKLRLEFQIKESAIDDDFLKHTQVLDSIPYKMLTIGQFRIVKTYDIRLGVEIIEKIVIWSVKFDPSRFETGHQLPGQAELKTNDNILIQK